MDNRTLSADGITAASFTVIREEMQQRGYTFAHPMQAVIERVIHSTADFEFAELLQTSEGAVKAGIAALRHGCPIVTDVNMVRVGINQRRARSLGSGVHCFVGDVAPNDAGLAGLTRSAAGIHMAHEAGLLADAVVVIGNAPTALYAVIDCIEGQGAAPALVVGVPVGFINTAESKQALNLIDAAPWIITSGRKGGSPVAAAIVNALLRLALDETPDAV
jgi:precorrin-8X/cobalt-precorrin-8 methylmutase